MTFSTTTGCDRELFSSLMGLDSPDPDLAILAELLVSRIDLDGSASELASVQRGSSHNHACTYHFHRLEGVSGACRGDRVLGRRLRPPTLKRVLLDIVFFDHVTDNCSACSPLYPLVMSFDKSRYVRSGIVPGSVKRVPGVLEPCVDIDRRTREGSPE